jgi:hypothetical protein
LRRWADRSTRGVLVAHGAQEVLIADDVDLPAAGATPEDHRVAEVRWMVDADSIQSGRYSRPALRARAVAGGMVADRETCHTDVCSANGSHR